MLSPKLAANPFLRIVVTPDGLGVTDTFRAATAIVPTNVFTPQRRRQALAAGAGFIASPSPHFQYAHECPCVPALEDLAKYYTLASLDESLGRGQFGPKRRGGSKLRVGSRVATPE
jgi:hypothetical protein